MYQIIGISGGSNSGKTTVCRILNERLFKHYQNKEIAVINMDDFFWSTGDDRHVVDHELQFECYDIPSSVDWHSLTDKINMVTKADVLNHIVIVDGILIFNDLELSKMIDKKFFLCVSQENMRLRRSSRTYEYPDVKGYFERHVWPNYCTTLHSLSTNSHINFIDSNKLSPIEMVNEIFYNITEG